ncbi:O-antigen ligase family protein [Mucilaginibacter sp. X4EP1]|uniref:O-antigen ligase family protein n=1 Tax=Mucilaginibacter sp. X4EP1 TaxID=2723092 RepID=UPI0021677BDA|nr:O-antigen ligase family protein [Mucilaginibacter sp. X4EP1]MCS3815799.1 O-antigen ligase [Mucilaginibacter sp. X4EP1]
MPNGSVADNIQKKNLWDKIVAEKLSNPLVIAFLVLVSLGITFIIAREGYVAGVVMVCLMVGVPLAYACVINPEFGISVLIIASFFINYVSRFLPEETPIGLIIDVLTYLLIIGFFVRQKTERDWTRFRNPITYFILIWLGYNLLEVINPNSPTILEWVYTVRTVGFIMLMYFVFLFHIRSKEFLKFLIKLWLVLALIGGLVGFQQEYFGLLPFEHTWLHAIPERFPLLFIGGHLRKWGIFSDPVVFAYNMVAAALLCIALIISKIKPKQKLILGLGAAFFFTVMLYSGTRASYVIIPAAMVMLAILTFNKRVLFFVASAGLILGFLVVIPTSNPTLARFQSAFKPSKDASFEERAKNQERIKPYILSHPIGGGLGSVGVWGQRFAPNSYLAKFPPDSGYVRIAVEMGYIGLLIYCIFNFVIMYKGLNYYYLIKDPELKSYCLAMLLIIFAFDIGNYPQQALVQYPSNILFYLAMAILNVTMRLDLEQRESGILIKG